MADSLAERINSGVYAFRQFPGEKELAEEFGVSYMTARSAVHHLISRKIVSRKRNGRIMIGEAREEAEKSCLRVALLIPAFDSPIYTRWQASIGRVAKEMGSAAVRPVTYMNFDDPLFWDALQGFDGSFVIPAGMPISEEQLARMRALPRPPVVLGVDYGAAGLPSLDPFPAAGVAKVLDHLAERGHSRIACFNVQPMDREIEQRLAAWRLWLAGHALGGPLINEPVSTYSSPHDAAVATFARHLEADGLPGATAVFCVTVAAALGVYRALYDRGLVPGRDLAVASLDGEGMAAALSPSLTAIQPPDLASYARIGLQWMRGGRAWEGPFTLRDADPMLAMRESSEAALIAFRND